MLIGKCNRQAGFTYMGVLMLIAIAGIGMAGVGIVWHQDAQRENEKELLFIGEEYRSAIGSYYESSPSAAKQFPQSLDDLLLDKRFPNTKRHIRKLYADPITRSTEWGLIKQQAQITGIYSVSKLAPIKKFGFADQYEIFSTAVEYNEWRFNYIPDGASSTALLDK
jgi:type II secretory pathway pseudopilin PulG